MKIELHGFTITDFEKREFPPLKVTDARYMALCNRVEEGTATDADRAELAMMLEQVAPAA